VGRLTWSIALLVAFFGGARSIADRTRPVRAAIDCDHLTAADLPTLERCLVVRTDDVEMMMDLGRAYEQANEWARAESVYRRALTVDPEDGDARVRLGRVLLHRGDTVSARREALAALTLQPGRAAVLELIRATEDAASE
jgi:cytochrome c-type biogenesis protein CcmH/NrfG